MELIETIIDDTGVYFGQTKNGVPDGKGIKSYNFGIKVECYWENGLKTGKGYIDFGLLRLNVKFAAGYPKRLLNIPEIFKSVLPKHFSFRFPISISKTGENYQETLSFEDNYFSLCCFQGKILNNLEFLRKKVGKLRILEQQGKVIVTESEDDTLEGFCEIKDSFETKCGIFHQGNADRLVHMTENNEYKTLKIFHQGNLVSEVKIFYNHNLKIKTIKFETIRITHNQLKFDYLTNGSGYFYIRGNFRDMMFFMEMVHLLRSNDIKDCLMKIIGFISVQNLISKKF